MGRRVAARLSPALRQSPCGRGHLLPAQVTAALERSLPSGRMLFCSSGKTRFFHGGEARPEISVSPVLSWEHNCVFEESPLDLKTKLCVRVCGHSITQPHPTPFTATCFPKYLLNGLPPMTLAHPLPGEPERAIALTLQGMRRLRDVGRLTRSCGPSGPAPSYILT